MNSQGLFYGNSARSPGMQQRQGSRQAPNFEYTRDAMDNSAYFEDGDGGYEINRNDLARLNTSLAGGGGYGYEGAGSQSWNPGAFSQNGFPPSAMGPASRTARGPMQPGRRNLPTEWMSGPSMSMGMQGFGGGHMGPPPSNGMMRPGPGFEPEDSDELIPTAIVIKNIPFAVRKEELVEVMTHLNLPLPYAFNYHFDNGVFRGLAFANFTSADETAIVIEALNHYELNGRKLRVEYKKMLPVQERERIEREKRERRGQLEEQHRPMATPSLNNHPSMSSMNSRIAATSPSPVEQRSRQMNAGYGMPMEMQNPSMAGIDLNDQQTLQFYNEMVVFKADPGRNALVFPATLSAVQRRIVHTIAHMMTLSHQSTGSGDDRRVIVQKTPFPDGNMSPPLGQNAMLQPDGSRRTLNRSATTDFNEARAAETHLFNANANLRGQHSTGFLGLPESPGGLNSANVRSVKSFADLRSYTPSPAPSTASYQPNAHVHRVHDGNGGTPSLTPTTSNNPLLQQQQRSDDILNGLGNMNLGGGLNPAGSPRRLRPVFSWDNERVGQSNPSPAPIGSNRNFSSGTFADDNSSRVPGSQLPIRQPRGPAPERAPGFARRQNGQGTGHQQRGSDELSQRGQQQNGHPEIVVEH